MEPRTDERQPWWRKLDLIAPDGKPFLRRRGFDMRRGGGILVHRIDAPDPGIDLHDHPWWFVTIILRGGYTEEWAEARDASTLGAIAESMDRKADLGSGLAAGTWPRGTTRTWPRWSIHRMPLHVAHRITVCEPKTVTLVVRGPKIRRWGFFLPTGWEDWEAYDYKGRRPLRALSNRPGEDR